VIVSYRTQKSHTPVGTLRSFTHGLWQEMPEHIPSRAELRQSWSWTESSCTQGLNSWKNELHVYNAYWVIDWLIDFKHGTVPYQGKPHFLELYIAGLLKVSVSCLHFTPLTCPSTLLWGLGSTTQPCRYEPTKAAGLGERPSEDKPQEDRKPILHSLTRKQVTRQNHLFTHSPESEQGELGSPRLLRMGTVIRVMIVN
jgi:hypothetical protein